MHRPHIPKRNFRYRNSKILHNYLNDFKSRIFDFLEKDKINSENLTNNLRKCLV